MLEVEDHWTVRKLQTWWQITCSRVWASKEMKEKSRFLFQIVSRPPRKSGWVWPIAPLLLGGDVAAGPKPSQPAEAFRMPTNPAAACPHFP
jgi:hypothetical protein